MSKDIAIETPVVKEQSIQERKDRLELIKLEREHTEREEQDLALANFRTARKIAVENERGQKVAAQRSCPHVKRDGTANIGGQKDHRGNTIMICLNCNAMWINDELPMNLRLNFDGNRIGGPM